jgi:hypothetical protein
MGALITPAGLPAELTLDRAYRKGDGGQRVKLIQEWLTLQDHAVKVDGDFGSATELAVQRFQIRTGLPVDGIVNAATFRELTEPMRAALTPIAAAGRTVADLVVAHAEQHLKSHPREVGGKNRGPWVRLYMKGNQGPEWLWCAGFVTSLVKAAAAAAGKPAPVKYTVSCDSLAADGKQRGTFVRGTAVEQNTSLIGPGSIFLNRRTSTDWTHTGLVLAVHGDTFETIEGNTNDAGDSEGYEACRRIRGYAGKDFIRID